MQPNEVEHDRDQLAVEAVASGDADALAELIGRHDRWVRGVVFSVVGNAPDLDDVVQRVWFRIWQDASQLSDSTRWRPWMYRIARNAAIDALRSDRRRRDRLQQVAEQQQVLSTSVAEAPETLLSANEDAQAMMDAIESLPELYRAPFVLKHVEGWSYQQIAETLDIARDTVETRLVRARRRLKKQLSGVVAGS